MDVEIQHFEKRKRDGRRGVQKQDENIRDQKNKAILTYVICGDLQFFLITLLFDLLKRVCL